MKLEIKKMYEDVVLPTYGSEYAAGLDICSYENTVVYPQTRKLIHTGICVAWCDGLDAEKYYLRVAPRSGLSIRNSIDIGAGVIDYDYRGEIMICVINNSVDDKFIIQKNERIAQLILTKIEHFNKIVEVENLSETKRGDNGFGSTGK
jgi:dUTP pyrophosphatase